MALDSPLRIRHASTTDWTRCIVAPHITMRAGSQVITALHSLMQAAQLSAQALHTA